MLLMLAGLYETWLYEAHEVSETINQLDVRTFLL